MKVWKCKLQYTYQDGTEQITTTIINIADDAEPFEAAKAEYSKFAIFGKKLLAVDVREAATVRFPFELKTEYSTHHLKRKARAK